MYQAAVGSLLGLQRLGDTFTVDPCIPATWPSYTISWQAGSATYEIEVQNPTRRCRGVLSAKLDGADVDPNAIPISDDGKTYTVRIVLG
jgi:cyclic beta-1,2-glucan synthetase